MEGAPPGCQELRCPPPPPQRAALLRWIASSATAAGVQKLIAALVLKLIAALVDEAFLYFFILESRLKLFKVDLLKESCWEL